MKKGDLGPFRRHVGVCEHCGAPLSKPSPVSEHFPTCRWRRAMEEIEARVSPEGERIWNGQWNREL